MKCLLTVLLLWLSVPRILAQSMRFALMMDGHPLELGTDHRLADGSPVRVDVWRCYVSRIRLWNDGAVVWEEAESNHLLDADEPNSLVIPLHFPESMQADAISFLLGIDSATNVSGAMGGDLDPTKGMYWTWQSGYINLKVEGWSPQFQTRDQRFQFHLGGYLPPFANAQTVNLPLTGWPLTVMVDVGAFLKSIDLASQPSIMQPSAQAVRLSQLAASLFRTDGKD